MDKHYSSYQTGSSSMAGLGYPPLTTIQSDFIDRERLEIRSAMLGIHQRLAEIEKDLERMVPR